jgi:hypothetical protein
LISLTHKIVSKERKKTSEGNNARTSSKIKQEKKTNRRGWWGR